VWVHPLPWCYADGYCQVKVLFQNPKAEDTMQCIVCIGWLRKSSHVFGMLTCRVLSRTWLQVYGWLEGSTKKYTRAHVHSWLQLWRRYIRVHICYLEIPYCSHMLVKVCSPCHSVALSITVPARYSQWAEAMLALVQDRSGKLLWYFRFFCKVWIGVTVLLILYLSQLVSHSGPKWCSPWWRIGGATSVVTIHLST
jgi:hypothetical protein